MQVKDLTKNEDEKFLYSMVGRFASDPSLTPFDHAIYDLQLNKLHQVLNKIFLFSSQLVSKSEVKNFCDLIFFYANQLLS